LELVNPYLRYLLLDRLGNLQSHHLGKMQECLEYFQSRSDLGSFLLRVVFFSLFSIFCQFLVKPWLSSVQQNPFQLHLRVKELERMLDQEFLHVFQSINGII